MSERAASPFDLSDEAYRFLEPLLPKSKAGTKKDGRPWEYPIREIVNGICYVLRSGCAWTMLAHDFAPWSITFHYFNRWRRDGTWQKVHHKLSGDVREIDGRNRQPSVAVLNSQSIKTTEEGGPRGRDPGKKIHGRKWHLVVDTLGLVLGVVVHPANVQDGDGTKLVPGPLVHLFLRLRLIWADAGYAGQLVEWVRQLRAHKRLRLGIVKRSDNAKGFQVLPCRWVVERTFGWLGRQRRLSKDHELLTHTSETMIYVAMTGRMLRRLAR